MFRIMVDDRMALDLDRGVLRLIDMDPPRRKIAGTNKPTHTLFRWELTRVGCQALAAAFKEETP
jgi:hypothetical protein